MSPPRTLTVPGLRHRGSTQIRCYVCFTIGVGRTGPGTKIFIDVAIRALTFGSASQAHTSILGAVSGRRGRAVPTTKTRMAQLRTLVSQVNCLSRRSSDAVAVFSRSASGPLSLAYRAPCMVTCATDRMTPERDLNGEAGLSAQHNCAYGFVGVHYLSHSFLLIASVSSAMRHGQRRPE
jgi:hypothetical protein